jgi:hypothetical protein
MLRGRLVGNPAKLKPVVRAEAMQEFPQTPQ